MKYFKLLFLIFLASQTCISQIEIQGVIKDVNGPVPFASIVLKDSLNNVKTYDISDNNGSFILETEKGNYTLEVTFLGYKDFKKEVALEKTQTLPDIIIEKSTEELDEVLIKNRKPLIERKPDRLVFNVENSVAASGGNITDALSAAPGIRVERNAISMIGREASRIMINGRILPLSGEELVNFLNSINAADIKKVEIFANPPAKYEAAGNGGLINIIYKKGVKNSWKNSTTFAYNQNTFSFFTLGNNFLYSKNKIRFGFNINSNIGDERIIENTRTNFTSGPWKSNLNTKSQKDNISGRISLDYDISDKTSIGVQYLGDFSKPNTNDNIVTNVFDATASTLDSIIVNNGGNIRKVDTHSSNLYVTSKLDSLNRKISFSVDYFDYNNELEGDFIVNTFLPSGEFLGINQAQLNNSSQSIKNFNANIDVEHPFKFVDLSYGTRFSSITSKNKLENFDITSGTPILNTSLSNVFEYDENIFAVYINGSKAINDKVQIQAGLRYENTTTKGFSQSLDQTNENDYYTFFPTFYISYKRNENHDFSFNYGKRINRPNFRALNPFRFFSNSNSFSEGNPFLQPSFTNTFDFNYAFKRKLTTNVFFQNVNDGFGALFVANDLDNIQAIIRRNYYTGYTLGIGEIFSYRQSSWWEGQFQVYALGYKRDIDNDIVTESRNGIELYIDTSNTFSLGEFTKFQTNFFYSSKFQNGFFEYGETYGLDLGLSQSFLDNDLKLSMYVNDIFDTGSRNNVVSEINNVEVIFDSNYSRRFFRFSMSYNFGNKKVRARNRKFGNDEERRRTN